MFTWDTRPRGRCDPNGNSIPRRPASHTGFLAGATTCIFLLLLCGQKTPPVTATLLVFLNATARKNPTLAAMLTILAERHNCRWCSWAGARGSDGSCCALTSREVAKARHLWAGHCLGSPRRWARIRSAAFLLPCGCHSRVTLELPELAWCHLLYGRMFLEIRLKLLYLQWHILVAGYLFIEIINKSFAFMQSEFWNTSVVLHRTGKKIRKLTCTLRETTNLEEEKSSADCGNVFQNTSGQNFHRLSEPRSQRLCMYDDLL